MVQALVWWALGQIFGFPASLVQVDGRCDVAAPVNGCLFQRLRVCKDGRRRPAKAIWVSAA
jgi:hypothetical protein